MLCKEHPVGTTGDLFYTLSTIRQFGLTNQPLPRSYVIGTLDIDYAAQRPSSDELEWYKGLFADGIASLEKDGDGLLVTVDNAREEITLAIKPEARSIRLFSLNRCVLYGKTIDGLEATLEFIRP